MTIAIANRALSPIPIGLRVFSKTAESFGFGIYRNKINTKAKDLAMGFAEWSLPPEHLPCYSRSRGRQSRFELRFAKHKPELVAIPHCAPKDLQYLRNIKCRSRPRHWALLKKNKSYFNKVDLTDKIVLSHKNQLTFN